MSRAQWQKDPCDKLGGNVTVVNAELSRSMNGTLTYEL